jgi:hypothetical protein
MTQDLQNIRTIGLPLALGAAMTTVVMLLGALLWPEEDRRPDAERHHPSVAMVLDEPVDETRQKAPVDDPEETAAKLREYQASQRERRNAAAPR